LKPEIDRRHYTRPTREHTSVGGASLGGLLSLWLALHHADTFGAALAVSPSK
jgi:enterochelin esterase-like enzyme